MKARWLGGALLAAAAAGPLFAAPLMLKAAAWQYGAGVGAAGLLAIAVAAVFTLPIGFVIAVLPSVAGAAGLASAAGRWCRAARHPLTWAVAGWMIGGMAGAILTLADEPATSAAQGVTGWPFGAVGVLCALLARWRTSWSDVTSPRPCAGPRCLTRQEDAGCRVKPAHDVNAR